MDKEKLRLDLKNVGFVVYVVAVSCEYDRYRIFYIKNNQFIPIKFRKNEDAPNTWRTITTGIEGGYFECLNNNIKDPVRYIVRSLSDWLFNCKSGLHFYWLSGEEMINRTIINRTNRVIPLSKHIEEKEKLKSEITDLKEKLNYTISEVRMLRTELERVENPPMSPIPDGCNKLLFMEKRVDDQEVIIGKLMHRILRLKSKNNELKNQLVEISRTISTILKKDV